MKHNFLAIATLLFCISTAVYGASSSSSDTLTPVDNFLTAVEDDDLEALRALRRIRPNEIDYTHKFNEALDKAAELGSLDALQAIIQHPYMRTLNKSIFPKLAGIARRNGQQHVFRWLYKNGLGFNHRNVAKHIKEALHDGDREGVRFILTTKYVSSTMILEALTWAKDESIIHWIKKYAWALQKLKTDDAKEIHEDLLHNNLINFLLNPDSPQFPVDSIMHLTSVLYRRYKMHSTEKLDEELAAIQAKGYTHIAHFLTGLSDLRKSKEYAAEDGKGRKKLEVAFAYTLYNKWLEGKKAQPYL